MVSIPRWSRDLNIPDCYTSTCMYTGLATVVFSLLGPLWVLSQPCRSCSCVVSCYVFLMKLFYEQIKWWWSIDSWFLLFSSTDLVYNSSRQSCGCCCWTSWCCPRCPATHTLVSTILRRGPTPWISSTVQGHSGRAGWNGVRYYFILSYSGVCRILEWIIYTSSFIKIMAV